MRHLEEFKALNVEKDTQISVSIHDAHEALNTELCWDCLMPSAVNIIQRMSLKNVEVFDLLYKYKFLEPEEIIMMAKHALGLNIVHSSSLTIPDASQFIENTSGAIAYKDTNGVDTVAIVALDRIHSEAQLSITLPGRSIKVFYVLPTDYAQILDPDYYLNCDWDYYALFSRYMQYCVDVSASDFHFEVVSVNKEPVYRALCRIGTDREECNLFPLTAVMNKELIRETIKKRSSNQQAVLDLDNGSGVVVSISDVFGDESLEVRFTVIKVLYGYLCVCRLQGKKSAGMELEQLGFDPRIIQQLRNSSQKKSGLTLFTGKLRTGKNTTMAALLRYIVSQQDRLSLMSLEDPIEIVGPYPAVNYKGDISLLQSGIRLAKKLDLDYLALNEIPDSKVAFAVRDSVNSSIHTLTTWHMNRLWHLPHKLYEYYGESYRDVLSQINVVCNQRLYKQQCPDCRTEIHRDDYAEGQPNADSRIYQFFMKHEIVSSMVAGGCSTCDGTGYIKRKIVVLPEILVFSIELVAELFKVLRPYEMEIIIFNHMLKSEFSLEAQMCAALRDGRLGPQDILSII